MIRYYTTLAFAAICGAKTQGVLAFTPNMMRRSHHINTNDSSTTFVRNPTFLSYQDPSTLSMEELRSIAIESGFDAKTLGRKGLERIATIFKDRAIDNDEEATRNPIISTASDEDEDMIGPASPAMHGDDSQSSRRSSVFAAASYLDNISTSAAGAVSSYIEAKEDLDLLNKVGDEPPVDGVDSSPAVLDLNKKDDEVSKDENRNEEKSETTLEVENITNNDSLTSSNQMKKEEVGKKMYSRDLYTGRNTDPSIVSKKTMDDSQARFVAKDTFEIMDSSPRELAKAALRKKKQEGNFAEPVSGMKTFVPFGDSTSPKMGGSGMNARKIAVGPSMQNSKKSMNSSTNAKFDSIIGQKEMKSFSSPPKATQKSRVPKAKQSTGTPGINENISASPAELARAALRMRKGKETFEGTIEQASTTIGHVVLPDSCLGDSRGSKMGDSRLNSNGRSVGESYPSAPMPSANESMSAQQSSSSDGINQIAQPSTPKMQGVQVPGKKLKIEGTIESAANIDFMPLPGSCLGDSKGPKMGDSRLNSNGRSVGDEYPSAPMPSANESMSAQQSSSSDGINQIAQPSTPKMQGVQVPGKKLKIEGTIESAANIDFMPLPGSCLGDSKGPKMGDSRLNSNGRSVGDEYPSIDIKSEITAKETFTNDLMHGNVVASEQLTKTPDEALISTEYTRVNGDDDSFPGNDEANVDEKKMMEVSDVTDEVLEHQYVKTIKSELDEEVEDELISVTDDEVIEINDLDGIGSISDVESTMEVETPEAPERKAAPISELKLFIQELGNQVDDLKSKIETDKAEWKEIGKQNEELKNSYDELKKTNVKLSKKNAELKVLNAEYKKQNGLLLKQNQELQTKNKDFKEKNDYILKSSQQMMMGLKKENEELKKQLDGGKPTSSASAMKTPETSASRKAAPYFSRPAQPKVTKKVEKKVEPVLTSKPDPIITRKTDTPNFRVVSSFQKPPPTQTKKDVNNEKKEEPKNREEDPQRKGFKMNWTSM
ncbi:predicted protein [Chaetoceros tenuissimus]|uniref:Uncharacterized protein n=1 Tax=Chaetoceros tenuissimus TaxID=426638 RepID=A0AAD3HED4_9STRA|nr:predicted protein [Chaetoceros tenuissimus]